MQALSWSIDALRQWQYVGPCPGIQTDRVVAQRGAHTEALCLRFALRVARVVTAATGSVRSPCYHYNAGFLRRDLRDVALHSYCLQPAHHA